MKAGAIIFYSAKISLLLCLSVLLASCAGVKVSSISSSDYMALRRGDILTSHELSVYTGAALQVVGINKKKCGNEGETCRKALRETMGINTEQRLSALAELWLQEALKLDRDPHEPENMEPILNAYLETARHAYAYLFFTERTPSMRALEDRQTQIRDYYNFAMQQMLTALFAYYRDHPPQERESERGTSLQSGLWRITFRNEDVRLPSGRKIPEDLIPAASLSFAGLRNRYRHDGLGAELVAVTSNRVVDMKSAKIPFSETPFPAITAVMYFPGTSLEEVLATRHALVTVYDPYNQSDINLAGIRVPLAADFTSGYGLWLARSGFAAQSLLTLIGKGKALDVPRVYLMQPYNPNRSIVIMLHGLASSPEAWINVANELLGDETLRRHFQIWQVYYPTNVPIPFNNYAIRKAITETLKYFDPEGKAPSSQEITLVGHSMGGVLARLMVSSSENRLWDAFLTKYPLEGKRLAKLQEKLGPYVFFDPLPQVSRVIFIAAPHKGTPFAESTLARWAAGIVKVPFSVLGRLMDVAQLIVDPSSAKPTSLIRPFTSIDNLRSSDPFIRLAADLPISPQVRYHSIIGNNTPKVPLADSSDGVVPYASAHLEGAESELVVPSGHSVQETPAAILEIRRIMHLHLEELGKEAVGAKDSVP